MVHRPVSWLVALGIPGLSALVVLLLVWGVLEAELRLGASLRAARRRATLTALAASGWAGLTLLVAQRGWLARFEARPPPLLVLLLVTVVAAATLARASFGERLARGLPLWALLGFQAFRLPLELLLHRAAMVGSMSVEMSFSGYNFDILSGATAGLMALALATGWVGPRAALLWNVLGSLLLANIVVIAVAATPVFHAFGLGRHLNVWVTQPPFVLLPSVLVAAALFGHVLTFRKLRQLATAVDAGSGSGL